jgi:mono/diheme cytochrome c family protein
MSTHPAAAILLSALFAAGTARADAVAELLAAYGGGPFDSAAGADFWQQKHQGADAAGRSCATCHTADPRQPGRHAVTGKAIDPLADRPPGDREVARAQLQMDPGARMHDAGEGRHPDLPACPVRPDKVHRRTKADRG